MAACEHIARAIVQPLVRRYFQSNAPASEQKLDNSVVTVADREIEVSIRAYLKLHFPEYGLLGEELGAEGTDREYVWTIDPIDGTEAFVAGLPLFGTLLGVIRQRAGMREPILGAIYLPVQDQLVVGNRVRTVIDGRAVTMPSVTANVLLLGNIAECAKSLQPERWAALGRLAQGFRSVHTWGDCLGYVSLLTGKLRARLEFSLGVDDIAPIEPIIFGAGGFVSTCEGLTLSQALSILGDLSDTVSFSTLCTVSRAEHENILRELAR